MEGSVWCRNCSWWKKDITALLALQYNWVSNDIVTEGLVRCWDCSWWSQAQYCTPLKILKKQLKKWWTSHPSSIKLVVLVIILYFVSVITVFIKIYYSVILNLPFSLWNLPFFYMKIAIFALSIIFSWLYFWSVLRDLTRVVIHLHYSTWDQAKIMTSHSSYSNTWFIFVMFFQKTIFLKEPVYIISGGKCKDN